MSDPAEPLSAEELEAVRRWAAEPDTSAIRFTPAEMRRLLATLDAARQSAPATEPGTCDWGDCDEPTIALRNDRWGHGWLAVCRLHVADAPADEAAPLTATTRIAP